MTCFDARYWKNDTVQSNKTPTNRPKELIKNLPPCLFLVNGNVVDPQYNAILRSVLEECRRNNMPKETIERSIKRAVRLFAAMYWFMIKWNNIRLLKKITQNKVFLNLLAPDEHSVWLKRWLITRSECIIISIKMLLKSGIVWRNWKNNNKLDVLLILALPKSLKADKLPNFLINVVMPVLKNRILPKKKLLN